MESQLSRVVDGIPGLVWTAFPGGEFKFLNQRWCEYTGLSVAEGRGRGWESAVHPDDLADLRDRWRSMTASREPGEMEARLRRFDGEYRRFLVRACPLADASGEIAEWCGMAIEIEDRSRSEDTKRAHWWLSPGAREDHFRLIVDGIRAIALLMTPAGKIELGNRPLRDFFGKTSEELRGRPMGEAVHPDDRSRVMASWREAAETGHPYDVECRLRRADGAYRWFHSRGFPLRDPEERIVFWYLLQSDIDDRKRAEDAVRTSELNLRLMTETIPGMLWSATPKGVVDYCNARLVDYTGFSAEEIMGDGWKKLLHPDDVEPRERVWASCIETGAPYRMEVRTFHAADCTYRWCVTTALPLLDEQGRVLKWYGTILDMHDWKQAQEALRKTQAELAHMTRVTAMAELTASIAHEVNQPLSGIITNAGTCLRMLGADPPNVDGARETARRTIRDGNRASDVITRLRALFSKRDRAAESVDLNDATREVIALLLSELQKRRVAVRADLEADLPTVTGDRVQLQQVILNLIRNASDAMTAIEDRPRQLVIRTERDKGQFVRLTVQDTGVGLGPGNGEGIFEAFHTTKPGGMGIGLSVSRSIVESHRGRLWAAPNDGPGATFAFSIPCRSEPMTDARRPTSDHSPASMDAQRAAGNP